MNFLRLVRMKGSIPPKSLQSISSWKDLTSAIALLEWRAAKIVEARAEAEAMNEVDSGSDQRVARAVTEAYVAKQVAGFVSVLPRYFSETSAAILKTLFELVCGHHFLG